jgi:hypothetical protein
MDLSSLLILKNPWKIGLSILRMKKSMDAKYPIVFYIQKTFKNPDGSDLIDKKGERITQTIYLNKEVVANLAQG